MPEIRYPERTPEMPPSQDQRTILRGEVTVDWELARQIEERPGITVVTPTIRGRANMIGLAIDSVAKQDITDVEVVHSIIVDEDGGGPAVTRNWGIAEADTEWIAFLDDDDTMHPHHLRTLLGWALDHEADVVYPWFDLVVHGVPSNHADPLRAHDANGEPVSPLGMPVTSELLAQLDTHNFIPVTALVRRQALLSVEGFPTPGSGRWGHSECEDWGCWISLRNDGWKFSHCPDRTWTWHHHGLNTSGRPDRARATGLL